MGVPWFSQLEGAHRCNGKSLFCQKNEQNVLRRAIKCQVWSCGACKPSCVYSHNHPLWHASLTDLETLENAANAVSFPEHMPRALFWVSDLFFRCRFFILCTNVLKKWYISIEHVGNLKTRGMAKRSCHDLVSPSKVAELATMRQGHRRRWKLWSIGMKSG